MYVKDLTSFVVKSVPEIDHVMRAGKKNRCVCGVVDASAIHTL